MPKAAPLDYATPSQEPRGWIRRTIKISAIVFGTVGTIFGVCLLIVWMLFHQMDSVTLTIINQSTKVIDSAQITDGNGVPILSLGPIAPGGQSTASSHFGNDEGGESDMIISCGSKKASQAVWMLINTHGPYEYTATVSNTGVQLAYHVASKGGGEYDFASPTTMP
jgi:hypothetical protein